MACRNLEQKKQQKKLKRAYLQPGPYIQRPITSFLSEEAEISRLKIAPANEWILCRLWLAIIRIDFFEIHEFSR